MLNASAWYSILAVIEIARQNEANPDAPVLTRDIAAASKAPPGYLARLLTRLVKMRILTPSRGPTSGYSLAKEASEVSLLEVIEIADGPLAPEFPPKTRGGTPALPPSLVESLVKSIEAMRSELASSRLTDFL